MEHQEEGVQVPYESLSVEVLNAIIEEFVLQEGTDYGAECSLSDKVEQVRKQLVSGKAVIVFDANTETCFITRN